MELRPYQIEAIEAVKHEWEEGHQRTLLVLPTGCGKTVIFAQLAAEMSQRGKVLILAHRDELIRQAADKLYKFTGQFCGIEKGIEHSLDMFDITIGSVQTLSRQGRLETFGSSYFDTVIVDEAHHCLADSYRRILNHFNTANLLGVTATPDRGDKKNLAEIFDSIAFEYPLMEAIKSGYLCPVKAEMIPLNIDLNGVKYSMGDYTDSSLDEALDPYLEQIADEMAARVMDRKTVIFLPLIKTSQRFCELLNARGFHAAEVNGNSTDRKEILTDFESGKYNALCNSMLLTEGWDCPSVSCVVVLRPTTIRALYVQMVGRGMRPAAGKDDLLILDFLWMTGRHQLVKPAALISKKQEDAERMSKIIEQAEGGIDILDAEEQAERDAVREREASLARQLKEARTMKRGTVDPLMFGLMISNVDIADYAPIYAWEMEEPTDKQKLILAKFGIDAESVKYRGLASKLLDVLIGRAHQGLCTVKQMNRLKQYGFKELDAWTFKEATAMIDTIANNHWQLPGSVNPEEYKPGLWR